MNSEKIIYYDIRKDLEKYPDAWCYVIWSLRGPGKTYSTLKMGIDDNIKFAYMKRTIDDVEMICNSDAQGTDLSPYKPINRDLGTNIRASKIDRGLASCYHCNSEGQPYGDIVSYILSINKAFKFKGFDMSECDWVVWDEFIPQRGERINRAEGEQLLEFYMTVARDREKRGKKPLKLILLANANEISTPVTNELDLIDEMAEMQAEKVAEKYLVDRGILLHHLIEPEYLEAIKNSPIYKAMSNTAWGRTALQGDFGFNDFSNVTKMSLKGMSPFIELTYKSKKMYIYIRERDGFYYMTSSPAKCPFSYNLDKENGQKKFYYDFQIDLRNECIEEKFKFQKYSMYDLIVNYKKFFKV